MSYLLKIEFYKVVRNKWLLLCLFVPLFVVCLSSLIFYFDYKYYFDSLICFPCNPYLSYVAIVFKLFGYTLPFLIAVIVAQYYAINKDVSEIILYTLPLKRSKISISMHIVLLSMIFFAISLSYVTILSCINYFNLFWPNMSFWLYDMHCHLAMLFLKTMIAMLCLSIVQFELCNIFNSYIIPCVIVVLLSFSTIYLPEIVSYYHTHGYVQNIFVDFSLYRSNLCLREIFMLVIGPITVIIIRYLTTKKLCLITTVH